MTKVFDVPIPAAEPPPPPQKKGAQGAYVEPLVQIRSDPGQWFQIAETDKPSQANGIASNLRNGHTARPDGEYEFAVDGIKVFAKFNGSADEPYDIVRKGKVIS